jgi:integrase
VDILKAAAQLSKLNRASIAKTRSVLCAIFSHAMNQGEVEFEWNPAWRAGLPAAPKPLKTVAATYDEVKGYLAALREEPLCRAAIGLAALAGLRPSECRGLKWSDYDGAKQELFIRRSVWHTHEGEPKTDKSMAPVAVSGELRGILLDLWNAQGSPLDGYILAGEREGKPVILDNLSKRKIRPAVEKAGMVASPQCPLLFRPAKSL